VPRTVVPVQIADVQVAVGVAIVRRVVCATAHRVLSGLYRIRDDNRLAHRTKYLLFFKLANTTLSLTLPAGRQAQSKKLSV